MCVSARVRNRWPVAAFAALAFPSWGAPSSNAIPPQDGLADSPWPMFQHALRHSGRSSNAGPEQPALKWRFGVEGMPSSPAIGPDGTIYLPTGMLNEDTAGFLYAINPDGTLKWRTTLAGLPSHTTPTVATDGTIYVHVNGNEGNIAAIEKLYAINPNGTQKWVFKPNGDTASLTSHAQSAPAVAADGTIYFGSMNTFMFAVNPNGTQKWAVSPSSSSISSSPALGGDGTLYFLDALAERRFG